jgi:hypothetical protein
MNLKLFTNKKNIFSFFVVVFLFTFCFFYTPVFAQELENPLGEDRTDIIPILAGVIQKVLGVIGSITLLVFIAGGVMWLTSAGKQEQVAKGTKTMLYAIIGIFVIFSAYVILNAVISGLSG